jgi:DNA-binding transcriptional MerR regulator
MALTRKFLSALGIEADKIDEIISAHTETVDGLKEQLKQAKEAADKLPKVQEQLDSLKDAAKNSGDYAKLKDEFDKYKAQVAEEKTLTAKKAVLSKIAKDAGLSEAGIAKVLKYTDFASVELDEKGEAKDGKALLKSLKEEWPEYIQTVQTNGVKTPTPPANDGGKAKLTRADIFKKDDHGRYVMSTEERQKALAENPDLLH